ncbi:hypothetical protein VNI00_013535 [Paramarasmius palmivorus]|uniref:Uncharacterized protein n=1 Tax=Paramarasmius palmivorus TaxID=297713 RepID=A0AAW0BY13_9AGAR
MGSYIFAGTLGMFLWDLIIHLEDEYTLLLKPKIRLPTIVYLWSRFNALFGLVISTVFFTAPLGEHCAIVGKIMAGGLPPIVTSASFLRFFCVRAFYLDNRRVVTGFFLLFLIVTGFSALIPLASVGGRVGPESAYCTVTKKNTRLALAITTVAVINNLAIFVAIAIKLMPPRDEEEARDQTRMSRFRRLLQGKHLPALSRALWQEGQKYILTFVVSALITIAGFATGFVPEIYGYILVAPHIAIENSMMSYLIRRIRTAALDPDRNMDITLQFLNSGAAE